MTKAIYAIIGMKWRNSVDFVRHQPIGTPLILEREPTNAHDPNAVKVIINDRHVGFVPRGQAERLAPQMDKRNQARIEGRLVVDGMRAPAAEIEE